MRFRYTLSWLLATLMPGTLADGVEHLNQAGCERVVERLLFHNRQGRYWRGKFEGNSTDPAEVAGRPRAASPSMARNAQYQRVRLISRDMYCAIADRPEADQALAINELTETYVTRGVRVKLRAMSFVERERFVAVRGAVHTLRTQFWTPANWLELRLCKYIAMGVFTLGTKLFSRKQDSDGVWQPQVLLPMPANRNRGKQEQIFSPIYVPSPFRDPAQIKASQDTLLADHDISVSEEGKSANIDIFSATSRAFDHARHNNNYIPPTPRRGARAQVLADGVTYYCAGRMATRFGTRVLGLKRWHNAKYYFSNVSLYLNGDHYPELKKYLGHIYDRLNAGLRTTPCGVDEVGNAQFLSACFTSEVRCGPSDIAVQDLEWTEGGDAAAGNSIGGMEPPPSKEGCCYYCEGRRKQWFDSACCASAKRRTLFRSALMAHELPPGSPPGAVYTCPATGCGFAITAASVAAEALRRPLLTEGAALIEERTHRSKHAGQLPGRVKLSHADHIKRQMSLLHFNLNSCGSTLVICYAAGASKAQKHAMNAVLEKFKSLYRYRVNKGDREKKAPGNVVRHMLWTKDLMLDVLAARYGAPSSAEERKAAAEIAAAQEAGEYMADDAEPPAPAPAPSPAPAPKPPATHGMNLAALLGMATGAPPATASPSPADEPPQETIDDDIDPEGDVDDTLEATPDICGTYLTALRGVKTLLELQLELHVPWDDDDAGEGRKRHGAAAKKKGREWATALRKHCNGTCGHYYMHLAYEHLGELIIEHGPFQHGNDEILEKGLHRPASNPRPTQHAHPTTYYPLDDPPLLMFFNHLSIQRAARALAPTSHPTSPHPLPPLQEIVT